MTGPRAHPDRPKRAGWSDRQRMLFLKACSAAGLNDRQRYTVMHHAGCPLRYDKQRDARPSIKHPRNTNAQFCQVMAIVEAQAGMRGATVPGPREFRTWRDAAESGRKQLVNKARCIIAEAIQRMPAVFDAGLERYIVEHTTGADDADLVAVKPTSLDEVDGGQAHRVVEALRAFVGRRFDEARITPRNFDIPPSVKRRRKPGKEQSAA